MSALVCEGDDSLCMSSVHTYIDIHRKFVSAYNFVYPCWPVGDSSVLTTVIRTYLCMLNIFRHSGPLDQIDR